MSRPTSMIMMSHCPSGLPIKRGPSRDTAAHVVGSWSEAFLVWGPSILCNAAMCICLTVWGCVHCYAIRRRE